MRIITRLNVGGPARQALLLTRALQHERGYCSELISGLETAEEGSFSPPETNFTRLPVLKRSLDPIAGFRTVRTLTRLMRERRPHIVHTHMANAGGFGRLAAKRAAVPVVLHTFHGHVLRGYFPSPLNGALAAAERTLAGVTDALISVSSAVRDELLDIGIGRPSQWHVIPVGLDLQQFLDLASPPEAERKHRSRHQLGLPVPGPLIGIVGRLAPIKGHAVFIEAAARIAHSLPEAAFVVAGDGELRRKLETTARKELGDRVKFLGWVDDLPALYSALDVVVLTSRNEGTPVALIEAGAAAVPVVATGVGGVPEVVKEGATGLIVPPNDPGATAAAVLTLLENPHRARSMGATARDWVRKEFSADRLIEDLAGLYAELLARKGVMASSDAKG